MKSASDLTEEQKQTVHQWAEEGATLQDIQDRLDEEFGLRFTFMETRFLSGDLNLAIKSEAKDEPKKEEPDPAEDEAPAEQDIEPPHPEDPPLDPNAPQVPAPTVTVDQITTPGTLISGKVTFSGGKTASWSLDQFGRLALDPDDLEFRPSQEEVVAFQQELQRVAQKQGL